MSSQFGGARSADMVRRRLGVSKGDAAAPVEICEFDWTRPHVYAPVEQGRINAFADRALLGVRAALAKALRTEMPLVSRAHAVVYFRQAGEGACYALPLVHDSAVAGLLRIDASFAAGCVERLLGGTGTSAWQDRELSPAECSLLRDLAAVLCDAFVQAYRESGGPALSPAGEVVKNHLPLPLPPEHEVVQFVLAQGQASQSKPTLTFVFPHERIDFLAAGLPGLAPGPSPDQCRARLLAALNEADVHGEVWLRTAPTTMNHVLALEPGDVLLLPQGLHEPVEMTVRGRKLFEARLGTQHGQYAMEILSVH